MPDREAVRWKIEQGKCVFPDCERTADADPDDKFPMCAPHLAYSDAQSELDEIRFAENVLAPWVETCEAIHFDYLTRVMRNALEQLRDERAVWQDRMDQAGREIDQE